MTDATNNSSLTDPFGNLSALRLGQSFADKVGVKKLLTTVPVGKPNRQDFVRLHPDPAYRLTSAAIIELKDERETYLVSSDMAEQLPGEFSVATLFLAINTQGVIRLWPVKLPGPDGKHNEWHRSAAEAANRAMDGWVKVAANTSLGANEIFQARGALAEPVWPNVSLEDILKIAFSQRFVDSVDHPLVRRLQGVA
jgi:hypothetical protein